MTLPMTSEPAAPRSESALERLVVAATAQMFAQHGVALEQKLGSDRAGPPSVREAAGAVGALVELSGPLLRCELLILASFELLASSRPAGEEADLSRLRAGDWIYVRDWTKELVRQLGERVRDRLNPVGVVLSPGSPTAFSGSAAIAEGTRRGAPLELVSGSDRLRVWAHATPSPWAEAAIAQADLRSREA